MKAKIIAIGNSKGIRIPKTLLKEGGFEEEVFLEASGGSIVIRPVSAPRTGWGEAFQKMAKHNDDALIDQRADAISNWDRAEWEWK